MIKVYKLQLRLVVEEYNEEHKLVRGACVEERTLQETDTQHNALALFWNAKTKLREG